MKKNTIRNLITKLLILGLPLDGFSVFSIFGNTISVTVFSVIIFIILGTIVILHNGIIHKTRLLIPLMAVVISGIISLIGVLYYSSPLIDSFTSLAYTILLTSLLFIASQLKFESSEVKEILLFQIKFGSFIAVIGILQAISINFEAIPDLIFMMDNANISKIGLQVITSFSNYNRPMSVFAEPSWFGHYLVLNILWLLILKGRLYINWKFHLLLNSFALLLTLSFGSYALIIITLLLSRVSFKKRFNINRLLLGIIVLSVSITILFSIQPLTNAFFNRVSLIFASIRFFRDNLSYFTVNESTIMRISLAYSGLIIWINNATGFLFGSGIGQYGYTFNLLFGYKFSYSGIGWVNLLVEQGIFGFISFIYLLFSLSNKKGIINQGVSSSSSPRILVIMVIVAGFTGGFGFERSSSIWIIFTIIYLVVKSKKGLNSNNLSVKSL
jgi:hypothetical protein